MVKKKTTRKKSTSQKKKPNTKILTYIAWTLAIIALILGSLLTGYYIGFDDAKESFTKSSKQAESKQLKLLKKLEKTVTKKEKNVSKRLKEVLQREKVEKDKKEKLYISASHEFDGKPVSQEPKPIKRKKVILSHKPRLAIIVDDVGTSSQVKAIKSLNIPLTMSFLPPSRARPNTPKLASHESIYMVHLPMEAMNWSAEEPNTLRITDSQNHLYKRIKEIKKLFPKVKYINNHTGSKFTSNEVAMNRLITALVKNHIYFIDSRTTAKTKAPKVMKNFGLKYMARDVFLDHHMDKKYVLGQIKKAIKTAKVHGTAIAICHPHKNTLQALYESKKLLKDVDLVYINKLY